MTLEKKALTLAIMAARPCAVEHMRRMRDNIIELSNPHSVPFYLEQRDKKLYRKRKGK